MHPLSDRPGNLILGAAAAQLAAFVGCTLIDPPLFDIVLAGSVLAGILFLAFCFPTRFCVAWLLLTSLTLEMALHDLVSEATFQPTIAAIKGIEIALGVICMIRFGPVLDPFCPA